MTEDRELVDRLRGIADGPDLAHEEREVLHSAAAHIEGHNEAFATVVNDKHGLQEKLKQAVHNHQGTLEIIGRWRELLIALQQDLPGDIRIKRALAGEHPMRPAPWETKR